MHERHHYVSAKDTGFNCIHSDLYGNCSDIQADGSDSEDDDSNRCIRYIFLG